MQPEPLGISATHPVIRVSNEAVYNFHTKTLEKLGNDPPMDAFERFNDGKVDPRGCYWAGTITRDKDLNICKGATLYCRDSAGNVLPMLKDLSISNGLVWTRDGRTMYYIDTPCGQVDAFDFNMESGEISNRRAVITGFDFQKTGFPDGMLGPPEISQSMSLLSPCSSATCPAVRGKFVLVGRCAIDQKNRLWVARFNGGCVGCYDPETGRLLAEVLVPPEAGKQAGWERRGP